MAHLTLNLIGYPEVKVDDRVITNDLLRYQKAFALFVYLAMTKQPQSRLYLAELLWPELSEQTGLAYLRGRAGLAQLRPLLGKFLRIDRQELAFDDDSSHSLDVTEFQALIRNEQSLDKLEAAVALYRSDFCEGFLPDGVSAEYETWLFGWREHLRQQQMAALEKLITGYARWHEYQRAVQHAEQLLNMDPWVDGPHRWLMQLYTWQGQPQRGLAQYETYRRLRFEDTGLKPGREIESLRQEIVAGQLAPPKPVPFLAPLPPPHLVNRRDVSKAVIEALKSTAIVALVGMGGIGKTTLAAQVAYQVRGSFPDGVLWTSADLTPAGDSLLTWSRFYDYDLSGLVSLESQQTAWRGITEKRHILIVLDGVTATEQARVLLPHSLGCTTLLTTRSHSIAAALNAQQFELSCFDTTTGQQLLQTILGERAAREAATAADIVQLLEGLPLALEILAQRLSSRPQQSLQDVFVQLRRIRSRLDLLQLEDRAVRTSFELSWQMLDPSQQKLFATLALFSGQPFHPDAVAFILDDESISWALSDLAALSLLQWSSNNYYRQHALLADFAQEKLSTVDLDTSGLEKRMVEYYHDFASQHASNYEQLRLEWPNLQAALALAHRRRNWQLVYELGQLLTRAWFARARFTEARQAYRLSYDAARMLEDDKAVAQTLLEWGRACIEQGDYTEAQEHLSDSLTIFREFLADMAGAAEVQLMRGRVALEQSQLEQAEEWLLEAQQAFDQLNDRQKMAAVYFQRACISYRNHKYDDAQELCMSALSDLEQDALIPALNLLVDIYMKQGDLETAESFLVEARQLCEQLQDKANTALIEGKFGRLYLNKGDLKQAAQYRERSLASFRQMGDRKSEAYALYDLSLIAEKLADYPQAADLAQKSLDIFTLFDDTFNVMNNLLHMGDLYQAMEEYEQANIVWDRSLALANTLHSDQFVTALQRRLAQLAMASDLDSPAAH